MENYTQYKCLNHKVIFIAGGASGIGCEIVRAFVSQGSRVFFVDVNCEVGMKLALEFEKTQVVFECCDVTQIESLKASIDHACDIFGRIDALVNNAANDERHCFSGLSLVDWNANLAVNLTSAFVASQKVAPIMAQTGGGVIINFSSINALFGPENLVAYNTAKAGIIGLTKSLATELGNSRIRVNTVIPGWIATEKQLNTWLTPELEKLWTDNMCLKQRISPSEVAKLVLFLVSDDASMITSQKFILDGGWY